MLVVEDDEATRPSCRQPRRRRLRVSGAGRRGGGAAGDRGAPARLVVLDLRSRTAAASSCSIGSGRRRARHAHRSRAARDRAERPGGGRRPRAQLRSRSRRSPLQAVPLRGAARARARGAASQRGARARGLLRVASSPSIRRPRRAAGGRRVDLSAKEFALLHALAEEPTRVYGKHELLRDVWGYRSAGNTRTLDAHACRLRRS